MRKFAPLLVTTLVVLLTVVAPMVSSVGFGSSASASGGVITPPPAPEKFSGSNKLLLVGQKCANFDTDTGLGESCTDAENVLGDNLGCSGMFYTPRDPDDETNTLDVWYTNTVSYAQCYANALAKLAFIKTSSDCDKMSKDGDGWDTCTGVEDDLHDTLGCPNGDDGGGLFKQEGDYYVPNMARIATCQSKIDAIGALSLVRPPGAGPRQTTKQFAIDNGFVDKNGKPIGVASAGGSSSGSTTGADEEQLECESHAFGFGWAICGFIDMLTNIVEKVDDIITTQLKVETNTIFCQDKDSCRAYYTAWQSFRNIALGILVIIVLLAVISEALDMEILDAYTIRKALPRLLVASVAITLSWSLMQFAVQVSNDLGFGIRHLIYAPFASMSGSIDINFTESLATYFFGAVGYLLVGAAGILAYVGTAVLAIMVAIVVLILRQILIIMMVILAPVAIVAYILPNTQRYYKLWWESFLKALLMFPLIAGMIATGRVFSAIALSTGDNGISQLLGFVAYFAPYFMIPMTFKMSGAAMGALGGAVQSRAQGGFDALSKRRGNIMRDRFKRARSGGIYRGSNKLTRGLNKLGDYTLDADERLAVDIGEGRGVGRLTGKLGKKLLGGQADELGGQIARASNQHNAKAAQDLGMHYTAGWAGMGLLDSGHAGSGLSLEGRRAIDKEYGTEFDEHGNATAWRDLRNADFEDVQRMGTILKTHGADGSAAQMAGSELLNNAGELSRFGLHEETKRATTSDVLALTAASQGKLNGTEVASRRNKKAAAKGEQTDIKVADAEMVQLMRASEPKRADMRRGHGIKKDANGQAYNVYSDREVQEAESGETMPAFETKGARTALLTAGDGAIGASKGEYFKETLKAYKHHGSQKLPNGEYTPEALQIRKQFAKLVGTWGQNDPSGKVEADRVMAEMGMDAKEARELQYGSQDDGGAAEQNARRNAGGDSAPGAPQPPIPGGGLPPGVSPGPM